MPETNQEPTVIIATFTDYQVASEFFGLLLDALIKRAGVAEAEWAAKRGVMVHALAGTESEEAEVPK